MTWINPDTYDNGQAQIDIYGPIAGFDDRDNEVMLVKPYNADPENSFRDRKFWVWISNGPTGLEPDVPNGEGVTVLLSEIPTLIQYLSQIIEDVFDLEWANNE